MGSAVTTPSSALSPAQRWNTSLLTGEENLGLAGLASLLLCVVKRDVFQDLTLLLRSWEGPARPASKPALKGGSDAPSEPSQPCPGHPASVTCSHGAAGTCSRGTGSFRIYLINPHPGENSLSGVSLCFPSTQHSPLLSGNLAHVWGLSRGVQIRYRCL